MKFKTIVSALFSAYLAVSCTQVKADDTRQGSFQGEIKSWVKQDPILYPKEVYEEEESIEDKVRPLAFSKKLRINTSDSFRHYSNLPEDEGMKQLWCLSRKKGGMEEAWQHFPEIERFVETGIYEDDRSVMPSPGEISLGYRDNSSVVDLHIHPPPTRKAIKDWLTQKYGPPSRGKLDSALKNTISELALPSAADLYHVISGATEFYGHHPEGDHAAKIVSKHGVTEIRLTEWGEKKVKEGGIEMAQWYYYTKDRQMKSLRPEKGFVNPEQISDHNIEVSFTPIKSLKCKEIMR